MSGSASRLTALVALAAYVAGLGGALVFHEHGQQIAHECGEAAGCVADASDGTCADEKRADCGDHRHVRSRHAHCCGSHHHRHATSAGSRSSGSAHVVETKCATGQHLHGHSQPVPCPCDDRGPHEHDCPICQFLAVKQLPAAAATFAVEVGVVCELGLPPLRQPQLALPSLPLSRAPPVAV